MAEDADASINWDDFSENQILRKMRGYRTAVNRNKVSLDSLALRQTSAPNQSIVRQLEKELDAFSNRCDIMCSAYTYMANALDEEADQKKYDDLSKEVFLEKVTYRDKVLDAIAKKPAQTIVGGGDKATRDAAESSGSLKRVASDFKPFVLSNDHTPVQFREWTKNMETYYVVSKMDELRIVDQQVLLNKCIDSYLAGTLASQISDLTPIFPDKTQPYQESCISIIEQEFLATYPLSARRHQFYTFAGPQGMPARKVHETLRNLMLDADIDTMSRDDQLALRIVIAVPDEGLRHELLKLPQLSLNNVKACYTAWDQQKSAYGAVAPSSYAVAAAKAQSATARPQRQRPQQQQQRRPAPPRFPNIQRRRQELSGRCLRCGDKNHASNACVRYQNNQLNCSTCNKPGHLSSVCFEPARRADNANGQASARSLISLPHLPQSDQLLSEQAQRAQSATITELPTENQQTQQQQRPAIQYSGQANAVRSLGRQGEANRPTPFLTL